MNWSPQKLKNHLNLERLEPRNLLNADFGFDGNWLTLDNFSSDQSVTLSESVADYQFELLNGTWQGTNGPGVVGSGTPLLTVDKSTLNVAVGGLLIDDSTDVNVDVIFESFDLTNLSGALLLSDVGNIAQSPTSSLILPFVHLDGQSINLGNPTNDFGEVFVVAANAELRDSNEIQIGDSTIANELLLDAEGLVSTIMLADIHVGGRLSLASNSEIRFGDASFVFAGQVNFNTPGEAVVILQDVHLAGTNTAGELLIISANDISDADDSVLQVDSFATFIANPQTGEILLADDPNQNATGIGSTTDVIDISDFASFRGSRIQVGIDGADLGMGASTTFGLLNFQSDDEVSINEDDSTLLFGDYDDDNAVTQMDLVQGNRAGNLVLRSAGSIEDSDGAVIESQITQIFATSHIELGDDPDRSGWGDDNSTDYVLLRNGLIAAGDEIEIGLDGARRAAGARVEIARMAFQTPLGLNLINDQTLTFLGSTSVKRLNIEAAGAILSFNNTDVLVDKRATFDASLYIDLAQQATQSLHVGGTAVLNAPNYIFLGENQGLVSLTQTTFNSVGPVFAKTQSGLYLVGENTAAELHLISAGFISGAANSQLRVSGNAQFDAKNNISFLGGSVDGLLEVSAKAVFKTDRALLINGTGTAHFGRISLDVGGNALIWEDSGTRLVGEINGRHLQISSAGGITDGPGVQLRTIGLEMRAEGGVYVADRSTDVIEASGRAFFAGSQILVGSPGLTKFAELTFRSESSVRIYEDNSTHLASSNIAGAAEIVSAGNITNRPRTEILVQHRLDLNAAGRIFMATNAQDSIEVGGQAIFVAPQSIFFGDPATVNFRHLTFQTDGHAQFNEDSSTYLVQTSRAYRLDLASKGSITDASGTRLRVEENMALFADTGIFLAENSADVYHICEFAQLSAPEFIVFAKPGNVTIKRWVTLGNGFNQINVDSMQC